ncbi:MAG: CAAX prenyl protease-related protein [Kiritimatiellae bacterium]|nr:CAAX prenyl protease-related protein [Kiritimatiellia bacterium]
MDAPGDISCGERHAERASRRLAGLMSAATASHVAPYLLWLFPMAVFQFADILGFTVPCEWAAPVYAVKSLLCAILIVWLKPWRHYAPGGASVESRKSKVRSPNETTVQPSNRQTVKLSGRQTDGKSRGLAIGVSAGLAVAALWILPETPWLFSKASGFVSVYNRWLIMPPGDFPDYFRPDIFPALPERHPSLAYAPWVCGWVLTICKLLGSAFVISAAEEWFFRGFLYRWLRKGDFLSVDLARYDTQTFWLVVLVFGLEHDRWLAGMMAGAVYGWIVLRTGRIGPAIVAHATTNLALGIYVVLSRQYGFW